MTTATLLTATFIIAVPVPKERSTEAVAGEWLLESMTINDRPQAMSNQELKYIFTPDGKWTTYRRDEQLKHSSWQFTIDPTKDPPTFDARAESMETERQQILLGIYRLERDTLTLCFAKGNAARPTRFESTEKCPTITYTLKRAPSRSK